MQENTSYAHTVRNLRKFKKIVCHEGNIKFDNKYVVFE